MLDWLKPLLLMFYAPSRGAGLVRDRASLGVAAVLALAAQAAYDLFTQWPFVAETLAAPAAPFAAFGLLRDAAGGLLLVALAFVPLLIFFANLFERRASFGLVLRQEYAPVAATVFYAWSAAHLAALPVAWLARRGGFEARVIGETTALWRSYAEGGAVSPEVLAALLDPRKLASSFALTLVLPLAAVWLLVAARAALRLSWPRAVTVLIGAVAVMIVVSPVLAVVEMLLASPFLLVMAFLILRGYFSDVMRTQRARASFRQNLEAATLNPADASAHYNLGLIHFDRKELSEARERFRRAVEIDPDEVDAHYQLGRISRAEGKLAEAIEHFGRAVALAPEHAQNEIWREIGSTYLAAGQHSDAHDALERFLDHRPSDPESLYLDGRALAGMG
ncbi:MAG: tetratricopeptide repeat protein, partial [Acidobacteria bacterium]|nr:tetratricopeptide repeat protein [Acidobacteriota bacterium]